MQPDQPHRTFPARFSAAVRLLLEAAEYAKRLEKDPWQFAVEIGELKQLGLSNNDLRWLALTGLVDQRKEVTDEGDDQRQFWGTGKSALDETTCFLLTRNGILAALRASETGDSRLRTPVRTDELRGDGDVRVAESPPNDDQLISESDVPCWDSESRELRINSVLVKRFKWAAVNQEAVLAAFEEEGWPKRIDDPLPPQPDQDSKRRLSDTIKCLNQKQKNALLHFRGDGTGEGVVWQFHRPENQRSL